MKKLIFRKPFITKRDIVTAYQYITVAEGNLDIANRMCKKEGGIYTEQGVELIIQATEMYGLAARRLGFRSIKDMDDYKNRKNCL